MKKKITQFLAVGMILATILTLIGFIVHTVSISMEREQMRTLETVTAKINRNLSEYINGRWIQLDYMAEAMLTKSYRTQQEVFDALTGVKRAHGLQAVENRVLLLDEKGYYYTSTHGKVALWEEFSSSETVVQRDRTLILAYLAELEERQKSYICCIEMLEEPITSEDGAVFPYIVLALDQSIFDIDLSLGDFGTISDAFVMSNNGRKINAQEGVLDISRSYNILSGLENAEFLLGDDCTQMRANLQNGKSGAGFMRYNGEEYYISYHSLGINNWNTVFLLERGGMLDSISPIIYQVLMALTAGYTVLTGVILYVVIRRNKEHSRNHQLQQEAEMARRENQIKSEFMSRMSHDMRTPLNGITSLTAVARERLEDRETVDECLRNISIASDNLMDLITEVLDMSRIEYARDKVQLEPLPLRNFLESMQSMLEVRVVNLGLSLTLDTQALTEPDVLADRRALNHIFLNILGNSMKYTPSGGSISFCAYNTPPENGEAEYHFIISDTGVGMTKEYMEHIWERFTQEKGEEYARTQYMGVGLGMAITREMVDLLKGKISVESEKGKGSRFEISLRLTLCEMKEEDTAEETRVAIPKGKYRVLLAEDVLINREAMAMILESAGVSCDTAEDGIQTVKIFEMSEPGTYDAILMDVMMPRMDGNEAARRIRRLEREDAGIPIFALTANAYPEDCEKSLEAGMNLHLTKPMMLPEVLNALEEWCGKHEE